jgi:sugar lactone lactonase YvrE
VGALTLLGVAVCVTRRIPVARHRRAASVTCGVLRKLDPLLVAYASDHGTYPIARSADELRRALVPRYAKSLALVDGWGWPIRVAINAQNYVIWSAGSDNKPDGHPWKKAYDIEREDPTLDIVLHNDDLVQFHGGVTFADDHSVTVLDPRGDPANTGLLILNNALSNSVQLLRDGAIVAELTSSDDDPVRFEVPPGVYSLRARVFHDEQIDIPGSVTVARQRVIVRTLPLRGGIEALDVDGGGALYVADSFGNTIRKITPAGVVTTQFHSPSGLALDARGNIYVADAKNKAIRKITPDGRLTVLAANLADPQGLAVDRAGNVYVADTRMTRKITPAGTVRTVGEGWDLLGIGEVATDVAVDHSGNIYVADPQNDAIRKITPTGTMTIVGHAAGFNHPEGVAIDDAGTLYVADTLNNAIRKIAPDGKVTTLAGSVGQWGSADGIGSAARFNGPQGIAVDTAGNVYVTEGYVRLVDVNAYRIRKISPSGAVTTLAGRAKE